MKKVFSMILAMLLVLLLCACGDTAEKTSSDVNTIQDTAVSDITSNEDKSDNFSSNSAQPNNANNKNQATQNNSSNITNSSQKTGSKNVDLNTWIQDNPHKNIVCVKTLGLQQISFCDKDSNALINIKIPKEWKLEKSKNGYNVVKESQTIGSIVISKKADSKNETVNVFKGEMTTGELKVTNSIDCTKYDKTPMYTRTLYYSYDDKHGNEKFLALTVPYEEIDPSNILTMMTEVKKSEAYIEKNLGVLQIQDNSKKILILGNSFVGTSNIGGILQEMCGPDVLVEAHSRGYGTVLTYTSDIEMMQKIREGNYSAVFMCGLYYTSDVLELANMINACENSNTKLALFPAHNEQRFLIDNATSSYPNLLLLDWKAEIDNLISRGIDVSNFCINDAHKHSTPLAGYVGAHMAYRALFSKIPKATSFSQVPQWQLGLLGRYVTSGSILLYDENSVCFIE